MAIILIILFIFAIEYPAQAATKTGWVNIKDPIFGAIGNGTHDDTAAIQAAIDYAFANNLNAIYCPAGVYKTSSTLYLDPPGNMRVSGLGSPTIFNFSASFIGDPSGATNGQAPPCSIRPTFNNDIAFLVGSGQGMRVSDISVMGPSGGYRGQQSSNGVGIGLSGGSGGSSNNLIENTYVANFYTLYKTDANGAFGLNDSNTFRKVAGDNGYSCLLFGGTQNYINDVQEPRFNCTIGIDDEIAKPVTVVGGNISANNSAYASFSISSTSSLTGDNNSGYTFTTTIASPDAYINTVYDSYNIVTSHYGVVPLIMTGWNSSTNVATFSPWCWSCSEDQRNLNGSLVPFDFVTTDLTTATDLSSEIQVATTLYATERVRVFRGLGIHAIGTHVESTTCTTLVDTYTIAGGAFVDEVDNPQFNYDPGMTNGSMAQLYCQQMFPFIVVAKNIENQQVILRGGDYDQISSSSPVLIRDAYSIAPIYGEKLRGLSMFNYSAGTGSDSYQQTGGNYSYETLGRGGGLWDRDYLVPANWPTGQKAWFYAGESTGPFCGYEPCQWTTPSLSPELYSLVSGTLGSLGSYPLIACRTVFRSVDWNSTALTKLWLRSASCPGYSYGQNLTDALVGETLTWSYKGQSDKLYLDAKTLGWMFPGLGISINNGGGAVWYTVTGVYPQLGYVSVMNATSNAGSLLVGTKTTVYSCASSCTIGQAAYSWTAY